MAKIIGIDLGTSNSAAAVLMGGKPQIIPSAEGVTVGGGKAFPSVVAFTKDGQRLIGEPARRQAISNPDRTITAIKRKMGTSHKVTIDGKQHTPQEISAMILRKIKEDASAFIGEEVTEAIITVPAYFNDNQRQATKDAGRIAGLTVKRLINEPTAAAIAYGLDKENQNLKIAVLDLGGGTFDVTIMEMDNKVFEVISTSGDTQLGGTDMDKLLVDHVVAEIQKEHGLDVSKDSMAMRRIVEAVEKAKIELSTTPSTEINLPYLTATASGPVHVTTTLTQAKMEQIIDPVLKRLDAPIKKALADAKLEARAIDKVILVGGPTRMPSVQRIFESVLGKKPERTIDPMECVALGAAIQGGVLTGEVKDMLLLDVTPLSLGVETLGGVFTRLIERNTTIPVRKSEVFSTAAENQTTVEIHVLQGERQMAKDNITLGKFHLGGIPPAPRGLPQIEVAFDIDENGILNVSAKDKGTGKSQSITITASSKLPEDEIRRKVEEAERHAEEDKKARDSAQLKNEAEALVYQVEKLLKENAQAVGDLGATVSGKVADLKAAIESGNHERIKAGIEALQASMHEVSARIYGKQPGQGDHAGGYPGASYGSEDAGPEPSEEERYRRATGQDDDVIDADYA